MVVVKVERRGGTGRGWDAVVERRRGGVGARGSLLVARGGDDDALTPLSALVTSSADSQVLRSFGGPPAHTNFTLIPQLHAFYRF